jgi:hypothetical protein
VSIRIINLTHKKQFCAGSVNKSNYFSSDYISYNLNTGLYRDLILARLKRLGKRRFIVDVYLATFKKGCDPQNNYHIEYEYSTEKDIGQPLILKSIGEWSEMPVRMKYHKMKD